MTQHRMLLGILVTLAVASGVLGFAHGKTAQAEQTIASLGSMLKHPAWYVRADAARALGRIQTAEAAALLASALGDGSGFVRSVVREALEAQGEAATLTITASLDAPNATVRWQAAWVLGRLGATAGVLPLLRALDDGSPTVRRESAVALVRIGTRHPDSRDTLVDGLAARLSHRRPDVREDAAWALGELASSRATVPLVAALDDVGAGWMAATALGVLGVPTSATQLASALRSESVRTRRAAAWALDQLRAPEATAALRRALGDEDPEVRYWAGQALDTISAHGAASVAAASRGTPWDREARRCAPPRSTARIGSGAVTFEGRRHRLYPDTLDARPDIPSPLTAADGTELVLAALQGGKYGIVPVTMTVKERQCEADGGDFPTLARTGLHAELELQRARAITGRSIGEIADLARPGSLSTDGFLGPNEDPIDVLLADNRTVMALGLTHAELARPLFHVWNMMRTDLDLDRWDMATHRWRNVVAIVSHGSTVNLVAGDTKGGQASIFADGLGGSFWMEVGRELSADERAFLDSRYGRLNPEQTSAFVRALTHIQTGEMEPHYVMWYGFYEGKTAWRTDPITIALVFGLRTLEQIEAAFPGRLYDVVMARCAGS